MGYKYNQFSTVNCHHYDYRNDRVAKWGENQRELGWFVSYFSLSTTALLSSSMRPTKLRTPLLHRCSTVLIRGGYNIKEEYASKYSGATLDVLISLVYDGCLRWHSQRSQYIPCSFTKIRLCWSIEKSI